MFRILEIAILLRRLSSPQFCCPLCVSGLLWNTASRLMVFIWTIYKSRKWIHPVWESLGRISSSAHGRYCQEQVYVQLFVESENNVTSSEIFMPLKYLDSSALKPWLKVTNWRPLDRRMTQLMVGASLIHWFNNCFRRVNFSFVIIILCKRVSCKLIVQGSNEIASIIQYCCISRRFAILLRLNRRCIFIFL